MTEPTVKIVVQYGVADDLGHVYGRPVATPEEAQADIEYWEQWKEEIRQHAYQEIREAGGDPSKKRTIWKFGGSGNEYRLRWYKRSHDVRRNHNDGGMKDRTFHVVTRLAGVPTPWEPINV